MIVLEHQKRSATRGAPTSCWRPVVCVVELDDRTHAQKSVSRLRVHSAKGAVQLQPGLLVQLHGDVLHDRDHVEDGLPDDKKLRCSLVTCNCVRQDSSSHNSLSRFFDLEPEVDEAVTIREPINGDDRCIRATMCCRTSPSPTAIATRR